MPEPLKIDHIGQNCAVPSDDDQPYNIAVYLNRGMDRYEQALLTEQLIALEAHEGVDPGTVQAGERIVVVVNSSRSEFKSRYRSLIVTALERTSAAAPPDRIRDDR